MALFENYEARVDQINATLNKYGIKDIEEAKKITVDAGLDVYHQVEGIQGICFENAKWAYTVGAAIAIKKGCKKASEGIMHRSRARLPLLRHERDKVEVGDAGADDIVAVVEGTLRKGEVSPPQKIVIDRPHSSPIRIRCFRAS